VELRISNKLRRQFILCRFKPITWERLF